MSLRCSVLLIAADLGTGFWGRGRDCFRPNWHLALKEAGAPQVVRNRHFTYHQNVTLRMPFARPQGRDPLPVLQCFFPQLGSLRSSFSLCLLFAIRCFLLKLRDGCTGGDYFYGDTVILARTVGLSWRNTITLIDPVVGLITCLLQQSLPGGRFPFPATVGSGESFGLSPSSPS